jgi:adenosylcobinamide-phosphate synthase
MLDNTHNSLFEGVGIYTLDFMAPERFLMALAAIFMTILLGLVSGPLAGNANPAFWTLVDKLFGGLGDRLDKTHRPRADLVFRGFLLTVAGLLAAFAAGVFAENLARESNFYGLAEPILLSLLITTGSVWFALLRLYSAMGQNKVGQGAYYAISRSTRRNLTVGDDFGITRAGMGFSAKAFDKGLVSPVFWYLVGGLPLVFIYSVLAALSWRFGKEGFTKGFGAVPMALERLMGFIPSLLAAFLITAASIFTPTAGIARSIGSWLGMKSRATYEQGGYPLSALAWALKVSLGGAAQDINGSALQGVWVGPEGATAKLNHGHLKRAIYMSIIAHFLFMAALGGAYIWANIIT